MPANHVTSAGESRSAHQNMRHHHGCMIIILFLATASSALRASTAGSMGWNRSSISRFLSSDMPLTSLPYAPPSSSISVRIRQRPVPEWAAGDYQSDPEFRARFQDWLNELWTVKDGDYAGLVEAARG